MYYNMYVHIYIYICIGREIIQYAMLYILHMLYYVVLHYGILFDNDRSMRSRGPHQVRTPRQRCLGTNLHVRLVSFIKITPPALHLPVTFPVKYNISRT